jgi:hypothetical protein
MVKGLFLIWFFLLIFVLLSPSSFGVDLQTCFIIANQHKKMLRVIIYVQKQEVDKQKKMMELITSRTGCEGTRTMVVVCFDFEMLQKLKRNFNLRQVQHLISHQPDSFYSSFLWGWMGRCFAVDIRQRSQL